MRVTRLDLTNFRGFAKVSIEFPHTGPIVLAGVNGCGKSSVLDALGSLLSGVPSSLAGSNRSWFAGGRHANIRAGASWASWGLNCDGLVKASWRLSAGTGVPPAIDPSPPLAHLSSWLNQKPEVDIPLLSHLHASATKEPEDRSGRDAGDWLSRSPRMAAYVGTFEVEARHHQELHTWLASAENLENQRKVQRKQFDYSLPSLAAVRRATTAFLSGLHADLRELRVLRAEMLGEITTSLVIQKGAQGLLVDQLSDGERRMLVLVADLARRAVIANSHLSDPLCSPGIVLIDEVEMHLHPVWQRRVMAALQATFPAVQFIVSTHSPHVLASVPNESVVVLKNCEVLPGPHRVSGRDANAILEGHMQTPSRPDDVDTLLKDLYKSLEAVPVEAKALLQKLEERLGSDDPEVVRARAVMELVGADVAEEEPEQYPADEGSG